MTLSIIIQLKTFFSSLFWMKSHLIIDESEHLFTYFWLPASTDCLLISLFIYSLRPGTRYNFFCILLAPRTLLDPDWWLMRRSVWQLYLSFIWGSLLLYRAWGVCLHSFRAHLSNDHPMQVFLCNSPFQQSPNNPSVTLSVEQRGETGHTSHLALDRF